MDSSNIFEQPQVLVTHRALNISVIQCSVIKPLGKL